MGKSVEMADEDADVILKYSRRSAPPQEEIPV
jgi:hypothetical protein